MICRGNPTSSATSNFASVTVIWQVQLAHKPPAEVVAIGVGIGRHRGDADDGLRIINFVSETSRQPPPHQFPWKQTIQDTKLESG